MRTLSEAFVQKDRERELIQQLTDPQDEFGRRLQRFAQEHALLQVQLQQYALEVAGNGQKVAKVPDDVDARLCDKLEAERRKLMHSYCSQ